MGRNRSSVGRNAADEVVAMAAEPLLRTIGSHLQQARDERGEDVRDVAEVLRIRTRYLLDLEAGDLAKIPGRAYALGFLRSYADYLGFDGEAIVDEVKRAGDRLPQSPRLHYREPLPESHRPPLVLVGVSLLLAAVVYVGWNLWQDGNRLPQLAADRMPVTQAPQSLASTEPAPPAAAVPSPSVPNVDDPVTGALASLDLPDLPPIPAVPRPGGPLAVVDEPEPEAPPEVDGATADEVVRAILADEDGPADAAAGERTVDPAPGAGGDDLMAVIAARLGGSAPRPLGDRDGGGRVVLVASEPSWVQIRSTDRNYVWTRTMERGDAYFVPPRDDLALWTGNAGGLTVIVDGQPLQPLGTTGQVRRDIPLAADRLHSQLARN